MNTHSRSSFARSETNAVKKGNEEKINAILLGSLTALAEKRYANSTIEHIGGASKLSKGLLHYYLESKEMLLQAVSLGSGILLRSAIERLSHANSSEHLAEVMIEVLRQNVEQHPRITRLVTEAWGESRRRDKLRIAFEGISETTEKLATFLIPNISPNYKSDSNQAQMTIRILLGLYQGLAIQLISQPDLLNDSYFRGVFNRNSCLENISSKSSD